MAPISLYDELTIELEQGKSGIKFRCDDASLSNASDNLVVHAAELFFKSVEQEPAVNIALKKKIPHGAGLGGGSSDAATILLGLNRLFATNRRREELAELAAQIGSDVPFFIHESAAFCSGRGEIVAPTRLRKKLSILLAKPAFGVPTSWAYSHWQNSRTLPEIYYAAQDVGDLEFVNDLERPVFEKFIFLAEMKMWFRKQPEVRATLLSGSGSTVFAVLDDAIDSEKLANRMHVALDPDLWTCACETV